MTIQDQYVSTVRQAQQTWTDAAESAAGTVQKAFAQSASPFAIINPTQAIDQIFDFWEKTLDVQREVAKQLVGATVAASDRAREQAESVAEAVRENVESAKRAAREQAESAEEAAHEQVVQKYDEMTKAELQEELASRELPKTGNVDELRERLVADDEK